MSKPTEYKSFTIKAADIGTDQKVALRHLKASDARNIEAFSRQVGELFSGEEVMGKHTPGPWLAGKTPKDPRVAGSKYDVTDSSCKMHVRVHCQNYEHEPAASNARLIAAAPELLEALYELLSNPNVRSALSGVSGEDALKRADAVIAKATGESK